MFANPYILDLIKKQLNDFDIFSLECALNLDHGTSLYNFMIKKEINNLSYVPYMDPEYYITMGFSNSIISKRNKIKNNGWDWKEDEKIVVIGSLNKVNVEKKARIQGVNIIGNNNLIVVESNVGLKNINIYGHNLNINFKTNQIHENLNIIDNNKTINF